MTITIEKIVYPGKALGRGEDGIATFTDGALAGEVVEVRITKNKKTFREAKLLEVVKPSPDRITARCPSYGKCGGCSFQHTDYANQVKLKEGYVREHLEKHCPEISDVVNSPLKWNYRNKMEFSFFFGEKGILDIGLHEKNEFNRYFPVPPCFICDSDFLPVTEIIRDFARSSGLPVYDKRVQTGFYRHLVLRKGVKTGDLLVNLVVNNIAFPRDIFAPLVEALKGRITSFHLTLNGSVSDAVKVDEKRLLFGPEIIRESLTVKGRAYSFLVSPFSFFQTNTLGTEILYETVLDLGHFKDTDTVLDLYCGTGTIGIVIAPYAKRVFGVEQVEDAVKNAELNRAGNGLDNISFWSGSVEKWIKSADVPAYNALVLDPPRGGLSNKIIDFIVRTAPEKIIYVSCNPSTLARDLEAIIEKGGYKPVKLVPLDMFPHTYHVECVAALEKLA